MLELEATPLFWILTSIQACGLVSAYLTRCPRAACPRRRECLFLAFLLLVGISTMVAMVAGHGAYWVFGAPPWA